MRKARLRACFFCTRNAFCCGYLRFAEIFRQSAVLFLWFLSFHQKKGTPPVSYIKISANDSGNECFRNRPPKGPPVGSLNTDFQTLSVSIPEMNISGIRTPEGAETRSPKSNPYTAPLIHPGNACFRDKAPKGRLPSEKDIKKSRNQMIPGLCRFTGESYLTLLVERRVTSW